jgi:hypothetical protein
MVNGAVGQCNEMDDIVYDAGDSYTPQFFQRKLVAVTSKESWVCGTQY